MIFDQVAYTVGEACKLLGFHRFSLWEWERDKKVFLPRRGPRRTILREDLEEFVGRRNYHRFLTGTPDLLRPLTEDELANGDRRWASIRARPREWARSRDREMEDLR